MTKTFVYILRGSLLLLAVTFAFPPVFAQKNKRSILPESFYVSSNLLNIIVHKPSISVEKKFGNNLSLQASFVQGRLDSFLLTDRYEYHGFLLRVKKYFAAISNGNIFPYAGVYFGNLQRNIDTEFGAEGGLLRLPPRHLSAQALRTGGTVGLFLNTKSRFIIDLQQSFGYGKYVHINHALSNRSPNGYVDVQWWLSVGCRL